MQESSGKAGAIFVLTRDARESLRRQPGKASKEHDAGISPANGNHNGNHQKTRDHAWCKVHGAEMQRRERDGNAWHSHKLADGTWCRGKSRNGRKAQ